MGRATRGMARGVMTNRSAELPAARDQSRPRAHFLAFDPRNGVYKFLVTCFFAGVATRADSVQPPFLLYCFASCAKPEVVLLPTEDQTKAGYKRNRGAERRGK